MEDYSLNYLKQLESESIYIIREVMAEFKNSVILYSIGKDSSVMVHLARKAFEPGKIPMPLLHIDTNYKFKEMIDFRNYFVDKIGAKLLVESNQPMIDKGIHPSKIGTERCCGQLKTKALIDGLNKHGFDAALGGARREEEKSRAKERIYSLRNEFGGWNPKTQRPELWNLYNPKLGNGESMRIFPLSNWTELDIWMYIKTENIEVVPLYFSRERKIVRRNNVIIPVDENIELKENEKVEMCHVRFRSLGCSPCTGAIESSATTVDEIISELVQAKYSERQNRVIDRGSENSMEESKKRGYF